MVEEENTIGTGDEFVYRADASEFGINYEMSFIQNVLYELNFRLHSESNYGQSGRITKDYLEHVLQDKEINEVEGILYAQKLFNQFEKFSIKVSAMEATLITAIAISPNRELPKSYVTSTNLFSENTINTYLKAVRNILLELNHHLLENEQIQVTSIPGDDNSLNIMLGLYPELNPDELSRLLGGLYRFDIKGTTPPASYSKYYSITKGHESQIPSPQDFEEIMNKGVVNENSGRYVRLLSRDERMYVLDRYLSNAGRYNLHKNRDIRMARNFFMICHGKKFEDLSFDKISLDLRVMVSNIRTKLKGYYSVDFIDTIPFLELLRELNE